MRIFLAALLIFASLAPAEQNRKAPRRQAQFQVSLIEANSTSTANDAAALVPAELKALLRFKSYHEIDSAFLRASEGETQRIALAGGDLLGELEFSVRQDGQIMVDVEIRREKGIVLETEVTVKNGEPTVLGASRMREASSALIVLLTVRLIP
jgi:hypothetical protein